MVGATRRNAAADEREHGSEGNEVKDAEDAKRYGCIVAREEEFESEWPDESSYSGPGYRKLSKIYYSVTQA